MDLGIAGRVALVTAASKGLGRASALALAHEGAKVVICARGEEALRTTEAELAAVTEVEAVVADATDPAVPASLVARAVERFGGLHILVANAGGPPPGRSLDVASDELLSKAINDNLLTSVRLVREAVPHMRSAGWGRICLITSDSIKKPIPTLSLSNTARTGLWAWAKTVASDVAPDGITLNTVCPGLHATDRIKELNLATPGEKIGDPADFGRVVAFLCSEQANYVNGAALLVDGGRFPGLF